MTRRSAFFLTLLVQILTVQAIYAQSPACTYERCALRFQLGFFSERLVQGAAATPVARLGLFAPNIQPLATAGDSTRAHYQAFRTLQNRGGTLTLVGTIAAVATGLVLASHLRSSSNNPPAAVWWLAGAGLTFEIVGVTQVRQARDQLNQAVWFYNGSLKAVQ